MLDNAISNLNHLNGEIDLLTPVGANFLHIYLAQVVFDNGSYRYFFESDWPDNPPYSAFINTYNAIGCTEQAKDIECVVSTFPFNNPHLSPECRNAFICDNNDEDNFEVKGWAIDCEVTKWFGKTIRVLFAAQRRVCITPH